MNLTNLREPSKPNELSKRSQIGTHFLVSKLKYKENFYHGGSPGVVVMGGDWRSRGREFESRHCVLDGSFFTFICCKSCTVAWTVHKINEKEAEDGPYLKRTFLPTVLGRIELEARRILHFFHKPPRTRGKFEGLWKKCSISFDYFSSGIIDDAADGDAACERGFGKHDLVL